MANNAVIKHMEFWCSDLERSIKFYDRILTIVGWKRIEKNSFSNGQTKIYFFDQKVKTHQTIGPRHVCFLGRSRKLVDQVANVLTKIKVDIIRGPLESRYKNRSSYTVDFRDPDGYIIEVATKSIKGHGK